MTRVDVRILSSGGVHRWNHDALFKAEMKVWALENTAAEGCKTEIRNGHADGQLLYVTQEPKPWRKP